MKQIYIEVMWQKLLHQIWRAKLKEMEQMNRSRVLIIITQQHLFGSWLLLNTRHNKNLVYQKNWQQEESCAR